MPNKLLYFVILILIVMGAFYFMSGQESTPVADDNNETVQESIIPNEAKEYAVDVDNSQLTWSAERIIGNGHEGTVKIASGQIATEAGQIKGGEFVIDMDSLVDADNNERLINHLKNEDFFNVSEYPTAKLVLKRATENENGFEVIADLTVKDQTHEIVFPASVQLTDEGAEVNAEFEIDRTKWGITYDSGSIFQQLGDQAIRDEIKFKLDLVLQSE